MEILSTNAENKLASLASSIGRDPESWERWSCLNLKTPTNINEKSECFGWVENITTSYLQNTDGRVFLCNDGQIYIICKDTPNTNLVHIAQLIYDIMKEKGTDNTDYRIFDLSKNGAAFASLFFERCNTNGFLGDYSSSIMEKANEHALSDLANNMLNNSDQANISAPRVLLVEDDPITRFMVRKAIKNECELATAPEGNKVFSIYASYQPDIVFLDINLPDLDGHDILEWIMDNDPGASVIMFSSNNDMENIVNCMDGGAKGFVSKPFSKEKLMHYIEKIS